MSMAGRRLAAARTVIVWLVAIFAFGNVASGATGDADEQYGLSGTVGAYPIALVVTVHDQTHVASAHYSYASQRKRINLAPGATGSSVVFHEPGGAVFDLHLVGPATPDGAPRTFYTSTGLVGTWTDKSRRLPVKLSIDRVGLGGEIQDCVLYPDPPPPLGVHFPQPGCQHTPDKVTLEACIRAPFTTDQAVSNCINAANRTCRDDQMDQNYCVGNLNSYLDQTIVRRLRAASSPMTVTAYRRWNVVTEANCKRTSGFSPDGTGYGADLGFCLAGEQLRLLQHGLRPSPKPIRD